MAVGNRLEVQEFAELWIGNPFKPGFGKKNDQLCGGNTPPQVIEMVDVYLGDLCKKGDIEEDFIIRTTLALEHYGRFKNVTNTGAPQKVLFIEKYKNHLPKQFDLELLRHLIEAAGRCGKMLDPSTGGAIIYGSDPLIEKLREDIWSVCFGGDLFIAATHSKKLQEENVLIVGETGTGKELVAEVIANSCFKKDKEQSLCAINVSAMPRELLESELYGYKRGAHSMATKDCNGLMQGTKSGTLLLDEIGELLLESQPKLLRALETRRVRKIGGAAEEAFDVRIVSATHRDLDQLVDAKEFRQDLLFRLREATITTVPLRELKTDTIEEIAMSLIASEVKDQLLKSPILSAIKKQFQGYPWPGNVRELRSMVNNLTLGRPLQSHPQRAMPAKGPYGSENPALPDFLADALDLKISRKALAERYVAYALEKLNNNKKKVAKTLGFDESQFSRSLKNL